MNNKSAVNKKNAGLSDEINDLYNRVAMMPEDMAARTLSRLIPDMKFDSGERWEPDNFELLYKLKEQTKALKNGDLSRAENILLSQAHVLDRLFHNEIMGAQQVDRWDVFKIKMDVALKSQRQCRATLETLAAIKNPPQPFVQNNLAAFQQVNNTNSCVVGNAGPKTPNLARVENLNPTKELLSTDGGNIETMDIGTAAATGSGHPALETVAAVHRT